MPKLPNDYYWEQVKKDKYALNVFIKNEFGFSLPDKSFSPKHSTPLDFVWETLTGKHKDIMLVANRSGGKTFNFALLAGLWNYFHNDCEVVDIGAVKKQADECYNYYKQIIKKPVYQAHYDPDKSLLSNTELNNGSKMQIFAGTVNAVNGPHPQKAMADEVELLTWQVLQEFFSMSKTNKGIIGQDVLGSTRKYSHGIVQKLLDEADVRGIKVYKWSVMEVLAKPKKTPDEWKAVTKKVGNKVISFWDIFGKHYNEYNGFLEEDDVIKKFLKLDWETFNTQWLCKKPSRKGTVYPYFENCIGNYKYNPELPTYACIDFGFSNPTVVLYLQITSDDDIIIIGEYRRTRTEISKMVESEFKARQQEYNIHDWSPDPAGAGEIAEMKSGGLSMRVQSARIEAGIPIIRKWTESGKLKVDSSCVKFIKEMNQYHYEKDKDGEPTDKPKKENDHGPDALRYFANRYIEEDKDAQADYTYIGIAGA